MAKRAVYLLDQINSCACVEIVHIGCWPYRPRQGCHAVVSGVALPSLAFIHLSDNYTHSMVLSRNESGRDSSIGCELSGRVIKCKLACMPTCKHRCFDDTPLILAEPMCMLLSVWLSCQVYVKV